MLFEIFSLMRYKQFEIFHYVYQWRLYRIISQFLFSHLKVELKLEYSFDSKITIKYLKPVWNSETQSIDPCKICLQIFGILLFGNSTYTIWIVYFILIQFFSSYVLYAIIVLVPDILQFFVFFKDIYIYAKKRRRNEYTRLLLMIFI